MSIIEKVKQVANHRSKLAELMAERRESIEIWENGHAELLGGLAKAISDLTEAETGLRTEALKIYEETGSKAPGPGLGIRLVSRLEYEPKEALAWATKHMIALKLDTPAFEKVAKVSLLDFVKISQDPQATIASDLEAVLKEAK